MRYYVTITEYNTDVNVTNIDTTSLTAKSLEHAREILNNTVVDRVAETRALGTPDEIIKDDYTKFEVFSDADRTIKVDEFEVHDIEATRIYPRPID